MECLKGTAGKTRLDMELFFAQVSKKRITDWKVLLSMNPQPVSKPHYRLNFLKAGFLTIIMVYGLVGAFNYNAFWFLHGIDLIFHEAGHVVFGFFGDFIQFLGGSLLQLLVPAGLTLYFFIKRQLFSSAVTMFWTAQNLMDISVYIKDARAMLLPLIGGGEHDWSYLLSSLNLLAYDQVIGKFVFVFGCLVFLVSMVLGLFYSFEEESE